MTRRAPKPLPPPTAEERARARDAAAALCAAIADPGTRGPASTMHVNLSRPRRGLWLTTWANLPGFVRTVGDGALPKYSHDLLPGWEYLRREIAAEMIPDLDALAERGERPAVATRAA